MRKYFLIFMLAATAAWAQKAEIGVTYGTGVFVTAHGNFTTVGAEACLNCQARRAYFLEYDHWGLTPAGGRTSKLNLVAGGLRIQGRNRYVRPFVDLGIGVGNYEGHPHDFVHKDEDIGIMGFVLGVGVTFSPVKHVYIRPQAKLVWAFDTAFMQAGVGAGIRF